MVRQIKILIVEDEMIIAAKISMYIEQMGYSVAGIIPSGKEAIDYCRDNPPDILLLDINLRSEIDGIEAAKSILTEHDIPIIYLTANSDDYNFERAKTTKPFAFISKPIKKIDLERSLKLVIERLLEKSDNTTARDNRTIIMSDRIFIRHKDAMLKILLEEIEYLEADRSYCKVCTHEAKYTLSNTLKALEEKIKDDRI